MKTSISFMEIHFVCNQFLLAFQKYKETAPNEVAADKMTVSDLLQQV